MSWLPCKKYKKTFYLIPVVMRVLKFDLGNRFAASYDKQPSNLPVHHILAINDTDSALIQYLFTLIPNNSVKRKPGSAFKGSVCAECVCVCVYIQGPAELCVHGEGGEVGSHIHIHTQAEALMMMMPVQFRPVFLGSTFSAGYCLSLRHKQNIASKLGKKSQPVKRPISDA